METPIFSKFQKSIAQKVLWSNPSPNSAYWGRPQELIREKEGECLTHSIPYTDRCRTKLNEEAVVIESSRDVGLAYQVQHTKDTMKDMKLKKAISGLGGADCLLCSYNQNEWLSEENIKNGFEITTTAESTRKLYCTLIEKGDGEVLRKQNDYKERRGITQEAIITSDQWSICITHSFINSVEWFVKVLARLNCEYLHWIEKSNCYGDHIRSATERVSEIIELETGL